MKKALDGYFHCECCPFKATRINSLVKFKGKVRCFRCKLKASKIISIPTSNPSDSTLLHHVHLTKQELRQITLPKKTIPNKKNLIGKVITGSTKIIQVGLTNQEHKFLWHHFDSLGYSEKRIEEEINKVKEQIKKSHNEFKENIKDIRPTSQDIFNKLIEVSR